MFTKSLHRALYVCGHRAPFDGGHCRVRHYILTCRGVRQARDLGHGPIGTVRHHRVNYVRTSSDHGTGAGQPGVFPGVGGRRGSGRGVRRIGGRQSHVGVPEVWVSIRCAEPGVYAGQSSVGDALVGHVEVGEVVQR